jgi:hypothetical protein
MNIKHIIFLAAFVFGTLILKAQQGPKFSITPELLLGITGESNSNFPNRNLQKQVILNLGWHHDTPKHYWLSFLKTHKSGISLGYTNLGNNSQLGHIFTLQPFLEFNTFKSKRFHLHVGTGASYVTETYDPITNPFNKAVSTDLTWAFRLFLNYTFLSAKSINWRVGAGYSHNSNGHTRLPNQGYNSFLLSLNAELKTFSNSVAKQLNVERERTMKKLQFTLLLANMANYTTVFLNLALGLTLGSTKPITITLTPINL